MSADRWVLTDEKIDAERKASKDGFDPKDGIVCELRRRDHRFARRIEALVLERVAGKIRRFRCGDHHSKKCEARDSLVADILSALERVAADEKAHCGTCHSIFADRDVCGDAFHGDEKARGGMGSQEAVPGVARRRGQDPPDESGKRAGAAQERGDATSAPTPVNPSDPAQNLPPRVHTHNGNACYMPQCYPTQNVERLRERAHEAADKSSGHEPSISVLHRAIDALADAAGRGKADGR